jgi:uncharacterized membrane protein
MTLVMLVISMAVVVVGPSSIAMGSVVRRAPVVVVIAARVVSMVPWIPVVTVPVCGVTKSDSNSSDPD